jgi:hypothetical protein
MAQKPFQSPNAKSSEATDVVLFFNFFFFHGLRPSSAFCGYKTQQLQHKKSNLVLLAKV